MTSKTEGQVDKNKSLINYDARLRDNVAVDLVTEITDTVQVCSRRGGRGSQSAGTRHSFSKSRLNTLRGFAASSVKGCQVMKRSSAGWHLQQAQLAVHCVQY